MLCLENSVTGGLILRTQQAEGLQISTDDKTEGKGGLPVRCLSSLCFWCLSAIWCLCNGGVSRPGTQLFKETAFLDKEAKFLPEVVELKRCLGEGLFPYFQLKGVVPLPPGWRGCSKPSVHVHREQGQWSHSVQEDATLCLLLCFCFVCLSALSLSFFLFFFLFLITWIYSLKLEQLCLDKRSV